MRLSQEDSQLRQATEVASAAPWILALPALLNFTSLFILYDFFFSFCILVLFLLIPPAANSLSFNNPTYIYIFTFLISQGSILQTFLQLFLTNQQFAQKCEPSFPTGAMSQILEMHTTEPYKEGGKAERGRLKMGYTHKTYIFLIELERHPHFWNRFREKLHASSAVYSDISFPGSCIFSFSSHLEISMLIIMWENQSQTEEKCNFLRVGPLHAEISISARSLCLTSHLCFPKRMGIEQSKCK